MDPFDLTSAIRNRSWLKRGRPFPHVIADDVFGPEIYAALEHAFQEIVARGLSDDYDPKRLSRNMAGYDAYGRSFSPQMDGPLHLFRSRAWHDAIARVAGVTSATGDVEGGLHYHLPGSGSGTVHNDLNPGWVVDNHDSDGINVSDRSACSYKHGTTFRAGVAPREVVRAVAVLFYLNNPPWQPGDGGCTGLYGTRDGLDGMPDAEVPPINNSLLIFECTPFSFHRFLTNHRHPRSTVIQWLHRPKDEVIGLWGEDRIIRWP